MTAPAPITAHTADLIREMRKPAKPKTPTMEKLREQLADATLRMDAVLLLAGMLNNGDAVAEPLSELLADDLDESDMQRCFPGIPPALLDEMDDEREFRDSFCAWAIDSGKLGFVVKFARPVMTWNLQADAASYSWGRYNTAWLYADTLDEVMARGLEWADEREAAEKTKAAALSTPAA